MGIYQSIYDLLMNAFYAISDSSLLTGWQDMTLTVLATIAVVFVFAIPFVVVWKVIQMICGR